MWVVRLIGVWSFLDVSETDTALSQRRDKVGFVTFHLIGPSTFGGTAYSTLEDSERTAGIFQIRNAGSKILEGMPESSRFGMPARRFGRNTGS